LGAALKIDDDRLAELKTHEFWEQIINSEPTLTKFCPHGIPYQAEVLQLVRKDFDYAHHGTLEILLSGSYGSAKSVLLAHLAVTHCLDNKKARVAIVRRSLPDLKKTIFKEIIEHIDEDLKEGIDYKIRYSSATIVFRNGSEIIAVTWADKRYKRVRSLKLSMVIIEEASENDENDYEGFLAIKARLNRLPKIHENVLICATNPDDPSHWLYDYFIAPNEGGKKHDTRFVFYSKTEQNIYLKRSYIEQLRRDMDAKRARRFLDGEWIELFKDKVYYSYSTDINYRNCPYHVEPDYPVYISWDFNIGVGKPLSVCLFQYINDEFHFFQEIVIEGMRTTNSLEELAAKGLLDLPVPKYIICGDASGKHQDTRNNQDDYSIIVKFLSNYETDDQKPIAFEKWVPLANPPVRKRHNLVNAYCENAVKERRLFVYEKCPMLHKGLRLVELKKHGDIVEDDSKDYQHVTTAAGYGMHAAILWNKKTPQRTREL
jgi:hypothetical protein